MKKETQEIKVLKIVESRKDLKTFEVMDRGLRQYITDSSRFLRKLAEKGFVVGERVDGKTYKKWNITNAGKKYLNDLQSL